MDWKSCHLRAARMSVWYPPKGEACGWSTSAVVRYQLDHAAGRVHVAGVGVLVDAGWRVVAPLTFGACAVVCAGNLFWAVKNRRGPGDQ